MTMTTPTTPERLRALLAKATPGPYRAHDHHDMARLGDDPAKWIGYAWVGRIVASSTPDGRFDPEWLNLDRRKDGHKEYRERASADAHFVAAALNALPHLLADVETLQAEVEGLRGKLRMIVAHATGGASDDIDRSVNDICVAISANRNHIYEAGKDAARTLLTKENGQ